MVDVQVASPAIWLKLTATKATPVEVDLCASAFDTKIVLMEGEGAFDDSKNSTWVIEDDSAVCSMITDSTRSSMRFVAQVRTCARAQGLPPRQCDRRGAVYFPPIAS